MAWKTKTYGTKQLLMAAVTAMTAVFSMPLIATAQKVGSQEAVQTVLTIEKVSVSDGTVTGEIRNRGRHDVRDIQLLVRYVWLWHDERKPGKVDPSTSSYHSLPTALAPGKNLPFTFAPPSTLAAPPGGNYEVSVTVAGFAQVIPQEE